jgi:hypothetical protein
MHKRVLLLSGLEWKERVAAAETAGQGDQKELWEKLDQIGARYRSLRASEYQKSQTSEAALGKYGRSNKDAIERFLEDHPALRTEIRSAQAAVDGQIQRFESIIRARQGSKQ